jgi:hypothetical protein
MREERDQSDLADTPRRAYQLLLLISLGAWLLFWIALLFHWPASAVIPLWLVGLPGQLWTIVEGVSRRRRR